MDKMSVYNKLPVYVQNMVCYWEGSKIKRKRYGSDFRIYSKEYASRNTWTYEQICEYRDAKLRRMVEHCYKSVPYYTRLFDDMGLDYRKIRTINDMSVLPVLTKQIVKEHFDEFISDKVEKNQLVKFHTSGTTGSGFVFYTTNEALSEQWALWWRYRRNLGIGFGSLCALFGGRSVVPIDQSKPPYFRLNKPNKQVYFSIYHLNENTFMDYILELEQGRIKWIHGYPSAIALLAQYMLDYNVNLSYKVDFITTGAENLLASQKEKIYKAFGVQVFQHYGLSEGVANFSQQPTGELIVDEDFAVTEFIGDTAGSKRIIGTSLSNYAMPLLRYDTGDMAEIKPVVTKLGREIIRIDGRNEDYVVLANGSKIGRLDHIFKDMVNINEAQIIQKMAGEIIIKVVRNSQYGESDEHMLIKEARQRLGDQEKILIEYVNMVERTNSGKLRFVISEIEGNKL